MLGFGVDGCGQYHVLYLKAFPNANRYILLLGIGDGVTYLHECSPPIYHGDRKGNNTLISNEGLPLLTDFGLSNIIEEVGSSRVSSSTLSMAVNAR